MTTMQIQGVKELTEKECIEINGGALPVIAILVWLGKTVGGALVSYGVWKGLDHVFYS